MPTKVTLDLQNVPRSVYYEKLLTSKVYLDGGCIMYLNVGVQETSKSLILNYLILNKCCLQKILIFYGFISDI